MMLRTDTYGDYVKRTIRDKKWGKYGVERVVDKLTNTPYFLTRNHAYLYLIVAMEEESRLEQVFRLTPGVMKSLSEDKSSLLLKALVEEESVHKTRSIGGLVFNSFGWAIDKVVNENLEDEEFKQVVTRVLNRVAVTLEEEGEEYQRVRIDYVTGKVEKVTIFTEEDVSNELVSLDIIKKGLIWGAK